MQKILFNICVSCLLLTLISCNNNQANNSTVNPNSPSATSVTTNVTESADKVKFKTEGGAELFSLKKQADGAKLVDASNQELVRIKADKAGKFKFKNAQDKTLGYVFATNSNWKLQNSEGKQDLYILSQQGNSYQLVDGGKKEIYSINADNNGLAITSPDKKLVYQVRVKEGKISLRNPSGKTVFSTKSNISPIAFACFGFDALTREQQAALAYAVSSTGGK
ncbi:hypothetical protein [Nostoc sp. TCL26-01]|uniref:hypothetical protein n=1 Tax=Nostoc sp. TCL26-01 TaxID=2576904 RepID=UPI0015B92AEF|nr:hypothetical protein [Nostoc sp. TCL26-01]QLE56994.1 hypothetical protein FD725_16600 [Nostoc sp. TCL26-01]